MRNITMEQQDKKQIESEKETSFMTGFFLGLLTALAVAALLAIS